MDEGTRFPPFSLPDQDGEERTLESLSGARGLVLYAYPKDDTPGCTVEATDFRDLVGAFRELGFEIAGISRDPAGSHCDFRDKYDLPFPLLTDADAELLAEIGAYGDKKMYGKVRQGILRSTFVVAADGTVLQAMHNVRAKGHAERVLQAVREL